MRRPQSSRRLTFSLFPVQTTAVTECITDAKRRGEENNHNSMDICFVNVGAITSSYKGGLKEAMLKKIVASLDFNGIPNEKAVEKMLRNKKTLILILDEMDMMFKKSHSGIPRCWFK